MVDPTLTNVDDFVGSEDTALDITYQDLLDAADESDRDGTVDAFRITSVTQGTLLLNGVLVVGPVDVTAGDTLIWTPPTDSQGTQEAFAIVAVDNDGGESSPTVPVNVDLAADGITKTGETVTHDETAGLQTTADPNNQDDTATALPTAFSDRLSTLYPAAVEIGHARSSDGSGEAAPVVTFDVGPDGVDDVKLTDANGDSLNGEPSSVYTLDGNQVFLFTDTDNNIVLGVEGVGDTPPADSTSGDIVFAVYLEEVLDSTTGEITAGILWVVQYEAVVHATAGDGTGSEHDEALDLTDQIFVTVTDQLVFDTFPTGGAGFRAWLGVDGPGEQDLLITGGIPGVDGVNNDSDDIGTNNQFVDPNEFARLDYVTNLNSAGDTSLLDTIDYDTHFSVTEGSFQFIQTGGNARNLVDVLVRVYDAADEEGASFADLTNTQLTITTVRVEDADGNLVAMATEDGTVNGIDFDFDSDGMGGVTVDNLVEGYQVFVGTETGFNRMEIENVSTGKHDGFALGNFRLDDTTTGIEEIGSLVALQDDGPTVGASQPSVIADEDDLVGGNNDTADGDDDPQNLTGNLSYTFGADGASAAADIAFSDTGLPALTSGGAAVSYNWDQSSHTLTAYLDSGPAGLDAADDVVFTLEVTDVSTGAYTFTLVKPLDHTAPASGDPAFENNIDLDLAFTVTDGDGDTAAGTLNVMIDDDLPVRSTTPVAAVVEEDDMAVADGDLSDGHNEDGSTNNDQATDATFGSLVSLVSFGAARS
jgi:T1SS-143 domain-containing protein